jgi:tetratricopeptide (TPR) repeat protein
MQQSIMNIKKFFERQTLSSVVTFLLALLAFLTPFIVLNLLSVIAMKHLTWALGIGLLAIVLCIHLFIRGSITLTHSWISYGAIALGLVSILSLFFHTSPQFALFGLFGETGTLAFLLISVMSILVPASFLKTLRSQVFVFASLLLGLSVGAGLWILEWFLNRSLFSWEVLAGAPQSLVGSSLDLAFVFGFLLITLVAVLEYVKLPRWIRFLSFFDILLLFLGLILMNAYVIWVFVGLISLVMTLYGFLYHSRITTPAPKHSLVRIAPTLISLIIFLGTLTALFIGPEIYNRLATWRNPVPVEIAPGWQTVGPLVKASFSENVLFGYGLNNFRQAWEAVRPHSASPYAFQTLSFDRGTSYMTTLLIAGGVLIVLFHILLLVAASMRLIRIIRAKKRASFHAKIYAWILLQLLMYTWAALIMLPVTVIPVIMGYLLIGLVYALERIIIPEISHTYDFTKDGRAAMLTVIGLLAVLSLTVIGSLVLIQRGGYMVLAARAQGVSGVDRALLLSRIAERTSIDVYQRLYARAALDVFIADTEDALASQQNPDPDRTRQYLDVIRRAYGRAINYRENHVANWTEFGAFYTTLGDLGIADAHTLAAEAYTTAQELAPKNPFIMISRAVLEQKMGNTLAMERFIEEAFALSPTVEGFLLQAENAFEARGIRGAEPFLIEARRLAPNDVRPYQSFIRYSLAENDLTRARSATEELLVRGFRTPDVYLLYVRILAELNDQTAITNLLAALRNTGDPIANELALFLGNAVQESQQTLEQISENVIESLEESETLPQDEVSEVTQ